MNENPTRGRIVDFVRAHPATSARGIQRGLGISWGTTAFHLRWLSRAGLLQRKVEGKFHRYFDPDFPLVDRELLMAMQSRVSRGILVVLARSEAGLPFLTLVEQAGEPKSEIAHHLRNLLTRQLIERWEGGPRPTYRVAQGPVILRLYGSHAESFEDRWADRVASTLGGLVR